MIKNKYNNNKLIRIKNKKFHVKKIIKALKLIYYY